MIRLVATDLDGTLLEEGGTLPEGTFEMVRRLKKAGIAFAVCSGRQFNNIRRLFLPVADDIMFICENGALCVKRDGSFDAEEIPESWAGEIMQDILAEGMDILISGRRSTYMLDTNREFTDSLVYTIRNTSSILHSIDELPEKPIKISGKIDSSRMEAVSRKFLAKWGNKVSAAVAGPEWFDFTLANKGTGLLKLMKDLGVSAEETAAFGDNFNDEPMLDLVGHPYIARNAVDALKKPGYSVFDNELSVLEQILRVQG